MTQMDSHYWEEHHRSHEGALEVNPHLVRLASRLGSGRIPEGSTALDAGCGRGASGVWLAEQGWEVTGVDISEAAIESARTHSADRGVDVRWLHLDLTTGAAPAPSYDLVCSFHVHPVIPMAAFVARLGQLVAPGGALLVVGHHASDEGSRESAPIDVSVAAHSLTAELDPAGWEMHVEEDVPGGTNRHGLVRRDVVLLARRR